jgi:hypothetical protein
MTGRRDLDGGVGFSVPEEYEDLAERVTRHLSSYSIDPATRARHLHHLRELAATQPLPRPVSRRVGSRWRELPRRVVGAAAASLAVVTLSGSAVAAASQNALPGDLLYATKRFVERVELAAALTPEGDVALLLDHAKHRLGETEKLLERGVTDEQLLASTLADMQHELQAAERIAGDDERLRRQVVASATAALARLEPMAQDDELPETARKSADAARAAAQEAASTPSAPNAPDERGKMRFGPAEGWEPSGSHPQTPQPSDREPKPEIPQLPSDMESEPGRGWNRESEPGRGWNRESEPNWGREPGRDQRPTPDWGRDWEPRNPTSYSYPTSYPTSYPRAPTWNNLPSPERTAPAGASSSSGGVEPAQESTTSMTESPSPANGSSEVESPPLP